MNVGHTLRRLPVVDQLLPSNSLEMLRIASQLQKFGDISHGKIFFFQVSPS